MASPQKIERIRKLLDRLNLDRHDLSIYDPSWANYEEVSDSTAEEILAFLLDEWSMTEEMEDA